MEARVTNARHDAEPIAEVHGRCARTAEYFRTVTVMYKLINRPMRL